MRSLVEVCDSRQNHELPVIPATLSPHAAARKARGKRAKRTPGITAAALFQNLLEGPGCRLGQHSGKTLQDSETNKPRSTPANKAVNTSKKLAKNIMVLASSA